MKISELIQKLSLLNGDIEVIVYYTPTNIGEEGLFELHDNDVYVHEGELIIDAIQ